MIIVKVRAEDTKALAKFNFTVFIVDMQGTRRILFVSACLVAIFQSIP